MAIQDVIRDAQKIINEARKIINKGLKPYNLTSSEGKIILYLSSQTKESSQEDLVIDLEITKAAVSREVKHLVLKGYISKKKSSLDKREYILTLTNKAKEIAQDIIDVYNSVYIKAVENIKEEEIRSLINLFSKVSKNLGLGGNDD